MRIAINAAIGGLNSGFVSALAHAAGLTGWWSLGCVAVSLLFMFSFASVIAL